MTKPIRNLLAIIIATGVIAAAGLCHAQTTNTNAPPDLSGVPGVLQPVILTLESIPTKPLNEAKVFFDIGAWNGPRLSGGTALQNYIDGSYRVATNVAVGIGIRNVLNVLDYAGGHVQFIYDVSPAIQFDPGVEGGWSLDDKSPCVSLNFLSFRTRTVTPGPTVDMKAGWTEIIRGGNSVGTLSGKLGINFAF